MEEPKRHYRHLSAEQRAMIAIGTKQGQSMRAVARLVGCSVSTVSRELRRNGGADSYEVTAAGAGYRERRRRCVRRRKLIEGSSLWRAVDDRLRFLHWSPEQIAARLRVMHPDDRSFWISHETIYAAIYAHPRGALREGLIELLAQRKPQRGRRRRTAASAGLRVPEALRIAERPEDVTARKVPGHWEGDLVKGAFNRSAVGTLVERKTRFVVLCKMDGCTAADAVDGFTRQLKKIPAFLRESLTYDRGSEMSHHEELARRLDIDIWFADPYAPWQRGSNENTNGLLRRYLPKGMDLSTVSQYTLNRIAGLLNGRPRKTLAWRTPNEALAEEIAHFEKSVALDS